MQAIVLDGQVKSALSAVRALGKAGVRVKVGARRASAMALHSKYATEQFVYPDPKVDQAGFVEVLKAQAGEEKPVLYCFSDATYLSVARNRSVLEEHFTLVLPDSEQIETAFSKVATYELARTLRIPTIPELTLETIQNFPVVVKPRHSVSWVAGAGAAGTAEMLFDERSFTAHYEKVAAETGEVPVIQQFITGGEFGVELLCKEGEVLQEFAHERLRSLSPRGGAATVKRTAAKTTATNQMHEYSRQLAAALQWTGPMMVEWKMDERTGSPVLMEINGRFWGSLPLAQAAGVDFVNGHYALATGTELPATAPPKQLTTQHLLGDCLWLWRVLFVKDPLRKQLYPSRFMAMLQVEWSFWVHRGDIWSSWDPLPFFYELIDAIKK